MKGVVNMNANSCLFERISAFAIGVLLSIGTLGLIVISLTVVPIVGLIFAVPSGILATYFFKVHFDRKCQIQTQSQ